MLKSVQPGISFQVKMYYMKRERRVFQLTQNCVFSQSYQKIISIITSNCRNQQDNCELELTIAGFPFQIRKVILKNGEKIWSFVFSINYQRYLLLLFFGLNKWKLKIRTFYSNIFETRQLYPLRQFVCLLLIFFTSEMFTVDLWSVKLETPNSSTRLIQLVSVEPGIRVLHMYKKFPMYDKRT